jgi:hypothetical protein
MIDSSIQVLLAREHEMRFAKSRTARINAGAYVIETASHHPDLRLRRHAANHLRSRGVTVLYDTDLAV